MNKNIDFNKETAFKRISVNLLISAGITAFTLMIVGIAIFSEAGSNLIIPARFVVSIVLITYIVKFYFAYLYIKTLKQSYDSHELRTEYKIILEHINVARIQIVNNVYITQGFIDKLFGIYTVTIDYGFGDNGYNHSFNFLSKEQSEEVANAIRSKTDLGVLINKKR